MSYRTTTIKYMFDTQPGDVAPTTTFDPHPDGAAPTATLDRDPVPLERLEAQICELAGHLAAATCRFLVLLAPGRPRHARSSR
jgi:hypothetical protein